MLDNGAGEWHRDQKMSVELMIENRWKLELGNENRHYQMKISFHNDCVCYNLTICAFLCSSPVDLKVQRQTYRVLNTSEPEVSVNYFRRCVTEHVHRFQSQRQHERTNMSCPLYLHTGHSSLCHIASLLAWLNFNDTLILDQVPASPMS